MSTIITLKTLKLWHTGK